MSNYDWMDEARALAAQCWCDEETKHTVMDPVLAEAVARRIAAWMRTGAQHARNEEYWRERALKAETSLPAAEDARMVALQDANAQLADIQQRRIDRAERLGIAAEDVQGWGPIETAPKGAKGHAWMWLAWGPMDDICTGEGYRWGDRFFAVGTFYCAGKEKQYEFREIEVQPTHWMPKPTAPVMSQEPAAPTLLPPDNDPMVLELARDAARYRWLRDGKAHRVDCTNRNGKPVVYLIGSREEAVDFSEKLDATIDAALSAANKGEKS